MSEPPCPLCGHGALRHFGCGGLSPQTCQKAGINSRSQRHRTDRCRPQASAPTDGESARAYSLHGDETAPCAARAGRHRGSTAPPVNGSRNGTHEVSGAYRRLVGAAARRMRRLRPRSAPRLRPGDVAIPFRHVFIATGTHSLRTHRAANRCRQGQRPEGLEPAGAIGTREGGHHRPASQPGRPERSRHPRALRRANKPGGSCAGKNLAVQARAMRIGRIPLPRRPDQKVHHPCL